MITFKQFLAEGEDAIIVRLVQNLMKKGESVYINGKTWNTATGKSNMPQLHKISAIENEGEGRDPNTKGMRVYIDDVPGSDDYFFQFDEDDDTNMVLKKEGDKWVIRSATPTKQKGTDHLSI